MIDTNVSYSKEDVGKTYTEENLLHAYSWTRSISKW
jgi:hypothetical protein